MLRSIGSTSMASTTMVPTSAAPFQRVIHFPPPEIHRNQRVQPVTSGSTAQPEVDLEVVATEWFESLGSGARRLWQGIVQHSPVSANLGRFAETRLLFSLGSLASGTWNTYASSFKAFLQFLHTESIPLTEISEVTLEMYVCHLAESPGKTLSAATVASYLSGIRTCLKTLGIVLADQTATAGALAGYKRFANAVTPPPLQHAAWPLEYTDLAIRRARDLMPAFRAGTLDSHGYTTVVSAAHIVLGSLTFSRGHTTNNVIIDDFEFAPAGFSIALRTQKRPQDRLPQQQHSVQSGRSSRTHPVQFLLDYVDALFFRGAVPSDFLFTTLKGRSLSLDAAVKHFVALCNLPHSQHAPLTGHTVRVGAVSTAFALGVPLVTCAYMCAHKQLASTQGYIRHGLQINLIAFQYYGHLCPGTLNGQSL